MRCAALPCSGASGIDGVLDAVRYLHYKAIYQTGGAPDCQKNKGNITSHNPPLLFDLDADMAEAAPLDSAANATVRGIIDKIGTNSADRKRKNALLNASDRTL